jgi:hypothetical protein
MEPNAPELTSCSNYMSVELIILREFWSFRVYLFSASVISSSSLSRTWNAVEVESDSREISLDKDYLRLGADIVMQSMNLLFEERLEPYFGSLPQFNVIF